jgi:hypothetical protein
VAGSGGRRGGRERRSPDAPRCGTVVGRREVVRARQQRFGTDAQVYWTEPYTLPIGLPAPAVAERTFVVMDAWLARIERDTRRCATVRQQSTFPTGVCDWSRPGVGQQTPVGSWLTYADGPGGRALALAPTSRALSRASAGSTDVTRRGPASGSLPATGIPAAARALGVLMVAAAAARRRRRRP